MGPRIRSNITGVSAAVKRKPLLLPAFGVAASILRAGQTKPVHFIVSQRIIAGQGALGKNIAGAKRARESLNARDGMP